MASRGIHYMPFSRQNAAVHCTRGQHVTFPLTYQNNYIRGYAAKTAAKGYNIATEFRLCTNVQVSGRWLSIQRPRTIIIPHPVTDSRHRISSQNREGDHAFSLSLPAPSIVSRQGQHESAYGNRCTIHYFFLRRIVDRFFCSWLPWLRQNTRPLLIEAVVGLRQVYRRQRIDQSAASTRTRFQHCCLFSGSPCARQTEVNRAAVAGSINL